MQLKERIREDIWRLAFALIIPPLLVASQFITLGLYAHIIFVCAFVPYTLAALWAYVYAYKNDKKSLGFFITRGFYAGAPAGIMTSLIIASLSSPISSILPYIWFVIIRDGLMGACLGVYYAYVFWAYVIHKGVKHKIFSAFVFLGGAIVPMGILYSALSESM